MNTPLMLGSLFMISFSLYTMQDNRHKQPSFDPSTFERTVSKFKARKPLEMAKGITIKNEPKKKNKYKSKL